MVTAGTSDSNQGFPSRNHARASTTCLRSGIDALQIHLTMEKICEENTRAKRQGAAQARWNEGCWFHVVWAVSQDGDVPHLFTSRATARVPRVRAAPVETKIGGTTAYQATVHVQASHRTKCFEDVNWTSIDF